MIIEYPISENYVKNWGIWEAVREFLQNAMDAGDCEVYWFNGMIRIYNTGSLCLSMLLLGESDKVAGARGQFGEGMKLAMLTLARMGRKVRVRSGGKQWVPELSHSEVFGMNIFKVKVESVMTSGVDVEIEVTEAEWLEIDNKRLKTSEFGILEHKRNGLIFVGGLYVCTLKGFENSYNFKPTEIELNRDRDIPSMFNIQNAAMKYMNDKELLEAIMKGSGEVNEYSYRGIGLAKEFIKTYGAECIPVGISEQGNIKAEKIKVVPDWLARNLRSHNDFSYETNDTSLADRLEAWKKNYVVVTHSEANDEFIEIVKEVRLMEENVIPF